ncbi:MAG TPA: hypothetical protein VFB01_13040 [Burkholderiales bacterium]|nr:hypothetical protein [Burkholderiales bacterium]
MITFPGGFVRLAIDPDKGPEDAAQALEHLLSVCRLNRLRRALIACASESDARHCHAALREALRFSAPGSMTGTRMGLVVPMPGAVLPQELQKSAIAAGLECKQFSDEAAAVRWLKAEVAS